MMSSNFQETDDASQVKQENDWEVVDYGPGEQEAVSDPVNDPLNYVGPNSTCNAEKDIPAIPVLKNEIPEQENDTVSAYFMSEVTDDTTIEEGGNDNEETETIIVAPEWSWEAMNETSDDSDNNTEAHDNSTRKDVFIGIDNNGILPSDSESVDNDDDDDDDYRVKSKKKKRKKSPDKNKSVKFAEDNYESLITSVKRKKYKKSPDMNKVEKIKLRDSEYAKHGSNKLEILNNPEDIYIPDGWSRRVFQRLSGKYPGKLDVLYIDPNGKKFKSKIDIIRYFCENNIKSEVDVKAMCFGYGRPGFLPVFPEGYKAPEKSSITKAPPKSNNLPPKSNNLPPKSNNLPLVKTQKTTEKRSKISNQDKYKKEISSHISEVSTICERLSVKDVTVEYSKEDFVNLTNHQVYTEYISAMLEAENPEVPASDISEIAEAKWKHFLVVKESKTATKEDKVSQELIEFLQEDDYEEPEDERDEDYKDDDAESNDSHGSDYATNPRKVKKSFKCPCCVVICYSIDVLGKHMKIHENEESYNIDDNPYGCPQCPEKLDSIENLFCHVETHGIIVNNKQQGSLFACIYCIKKCSTLANLKLHVNSHLKCRDEDGNVVMYSCPICHNRFTKILDLQKHINKLHNESELFACPHCPMKCTKIQNLNGHIRARHTEDGQNKLPDNKYKCIHCEYTTHRRERLAIHIRVHTGEKPFKCNVCDHATSSYSNLKLHELIHNETKRYQCNFCEYRCNQRNSLKTHERMHTDDRPFLCSECGHRCLTKNNLNLHMKNHVEGSECVCSVCGMKFLHTNSLKSHMANVHSYQSNSTKKFPCLQCNYMATTKGNLKVHMRVHTGDRNFECPECGKKFTQGGSLKIHIRKHTGEKPFGCRICDYRCTTKGNLLKHMIKHGGYTNKDIFEEKVEKCDNEEYSESNCKKILSDIMKSGSNLQIDQTDDEIQEDSQDVEIINDTCEKKSSDVIPSNLENIKKLNNSNNIDLTNNFKQTDYEVGQANYCEPQQSYNNIHQTNFPGENEGIQSYEKKTEDEEQHFLSGLFQ